MYLSLINCGFPAAILTRDVALGYRTFIDFLSCLVKQIYRTNTLEDLAKDFRVAAAGYSRLHLA